MTGEGTTAPGAVTGVIRECTPTPRSADKEECAEMGSACGGKGIPLGKDASGITAAEVAYAVT